MVLCADFVTTCIPLDMRFAACIFDPVDAIVDAIVGAIVDATVGVLLPGLLFDVLTCVLTCVLARVRVLSSDSVCSEPISCFLTFTSPFE